jgi:hypothetical protein
MIQLPDGRIQVQAGDTLWGIAQKYLGNGSRWGELGGFAGDPKRMPVGTIISLPGYKAPSSGGGGAAAGPAPLTPEQIAAKEEEAKYNKVIGDYSQIQNDWKYLLDPTDLEGKAILDSFLTRLADNPMLDPYYAQRVADGVVDPNSTENILQEMLADPAMTSRFGTKWLEALVTSANLQNENDFNYSAAAHARDQLGQARDLASSTMNTLDETQRSFAENGIRGGMRNAAINDVEDKAAGATQNMNATEEDWRRGYKAGNSASITGYAQSYRNDMAKNDWATLWSQSGIKNAGLKDKFLNYASSNWTT